MSDILTSVYDEGIISRFRKELGEKEPSKWYVLRVALAISLKLKTPLDEAWCENHTNGSQYNLKQASGLDKGTTGPDKDFTDAYRAMLSIYHDKNYFVDSQGFKKTLQGHMRRGLNEIDICLSNQYDVFDYLLETLFGEHKELSKETPHEQELVLNSLREFGIECLVEGVLIGPRVVRYMIKLTKAEYYEALLQRLDMLTIQLGLKDRYPFVSKTDVPLVVSLDIPRTPETWRTVMMADVWRKLEKTQTKARLPVYPGVDVTGQPFGFDLVDAPHLLVAGTTGSGKSICLRSLLYFLVRFNRPEDLNICLIDPKKVEFLQFGNLEHLYRGKVFVTIKESIETLRDMVGEMDFRNEELAKLGFTDLAAAEDKGLRPFPRLVVFVEELADLVMRSAEIQTFLARLAQMGRSTGIHLILATQRPDSETFTGLLRSNIPSRIALTVQKSTESQIILDETGAEKLTGRGDMLVKMTGEGAKRLQGAIVTASEVLTFAKKDKDAHL